MTGSSGRPGPEGRHGHARGRTPTPSWSRRRTRERGRTTITTTTTAPRASYGRRSGRRRSKMTRRSRNSATGERPGTSTSSGPWRKDGSGWHRRRCCAGSCATAGKPSTLGVQARGARRALEPEDEKEGSQGARRVLPEG